ncbi:hypothetical protein [Pseudomonas syringae]|uniref:Uncharacterized protein n=1 Tax=Pseudomonas syringae TaxID=317 RepID=A0AB38BZB2_PSESX|nr:hypothetical protein [Pseudomonas syringae]MCK0549331.1 hypothetical protein [Pseudomonas syringae pv. aptata]SFO44383.1 hypothetical protein SAMN05444065_11914 [Pseudomonas syringae]SFO79408.1 hypothetical protein SAMN05444063_12076 [Pseudomonas syringae]
MKWVVLAVAVISTLWQYSFRNERWWQDFALTMLSVSWMVAVIFFYDLMMAMLGKNSPYMKEFYLEVRRDLLFTFLAALVLLLVLYFSPVSYSLSNIDIAFFGLPFLLGSIWDVHSLVKLRIARVKFAKSFIYILLLALAVVAFLYVYFLIGIHSGSFSASKSLWLQITLLLSSFCLYIGAHQIVFIMQKQKIEISPVLHKFYSSIKFVRGFYEQVIKGVELWNFAVIQEKQKVRNANKKMKRKKRRR